MSNLPAVALRSLNRTLVVAIAVVGLGGGAAAVVLSAGDGDPDGSGDAASERSRDQAPTTTTLAPTPPPAPAYAAAYALVVEPEGPEAVAQALVAAEGAIRSGVADDAELEGWARTQQVGYRHLARNPDWDAAVAAQVGPELAPVVAANAQVFRELWALTDPRPELPDWVIVAPPPRQELLGYYEAAEAEFGVEWEYLAGIHLVETRMGRIRGASSAGARGPMQFIPSTWEAYGEGDIEDPGDSIRAAARYLVAAGAPGDMRKALFAYNHSDHYVAAVETYARLMRENARSYDAYYHWEVYYRLTTGDVVLPVGWTREDAPND